MSIPKEPRQQMINIMYLVLTALLALNVSAEILHAFGILNTSFDKSNLSLQEKLSDTRKTYDALSIKNPKGALYLPYVESSQAIGDKAIEYIDNLKDEIILTSNGPDYAGIGFRRADDQSTTTRILVDEKRASELKEVLSTTRQEFLEIFSSDAVNESEERLFKESDRDLFESAMALAAIDETPLDEFGTPTTWERKLFEQMPVAPTVTILNKFKNDIISTQTTSIESLLHLVSKDDKPFNQYEVGIVPSGRKFIQGESYEAEIFLAASRKGDQAKISVNGKEITEMINGRAQHRAGILQRLGKKLFNYRIDYIDSHGAPAIEEGQYEITVVPPPDHVPVISPTAMNILYVGVENPISATITGIPASGVTASISQGSLSPKETGQYTAKVTQAGNATINLKGTNQLGEEVNVASEFRVSNLPIPTGVMNKRKSGAMRTGTFKAQRAIFAELDDFFPFDVRFEVLGFEMTLVQAKNPDNLICTNVGGAFNGQCRNFQQAAQVGDTYYFDNVRVRGPDNKVHTVPIMTFKIN